MLNTAPRLPDPDATFAALVAVHRDLSPDSSRQFDARLILLLANHIGDADVLHAAIARARQGLTSETTA